MELDYKYKLITKFSEVKQLVNYCKQTGYCSSDFESSGTNAMYPGSYPTILGVSFQPGSAWVIPLGHKDSPFKNNWKEVLKYFGREVIENPDIVKIGQNIKFEMNWWRKYGITMSGRVFDTMLAKYLLDEERPHGLKEMVSKFIPDFQGYDLKGKPSDKSSTEQMIEFWSNVEINELSKYCALDSDLTFRLWVFFEPKLIKLGFYPLFRNMMMMASRVLAEAEWEGMVINRDYLEGLLEIYETKIEACEVRLRNVPIIITYETKNRKEKIKALIKETQIEIEQLRAGGSSEISIKNREQKISRYIAGEFTTNKENKLLEQLNFGSPTQMIDLLFTNKHGFNFEIVKYTSDKKTKKDTDRPSTDEEVLLELKLQDDTGFIDNLLELRELSKMYSTYVKGMWEKTNSKNKIHGSFLLHGTVCIGKDTPLLTNKGKIIVGDIIPKQKGVLNIEELGLEILTHNRRFKRITQAVNKGYHNMVEIISENGHRQECTPKHLLYTPDGWKSTKDCFEKSLPIYTYSLPSLMPLQKTIKPSVEIIKPIPGFDGYFVSNWGNVLTDKIKGAQGKRGNIKEKMSSRISKGYRRVGFRHKTHKKYNFKISTLVYTVFNGQIPDGYIIDHINCNKLDDYVTNLQILTPEENFNRAFIYNIKAHTRNLTHNQMFMIDKIISYKSLGKQLVCDITIEDDESYIANGFINHNTGRLSSRNPNLQNIPRDTTSSDIKKMFIAPKGKVLFQLDYSQAELRVLAAAAREETMMEWFRIGRDIHLASACHKMSWDYDERIKIWEDESHPLFKETKIERKKAKTINFGIVYGQTSKKLAITLSSEGHKVSEEEAQEFLDDFNRRFPRIAKYIKKQHKFAKENGFVYNLFGRKRRLENVWSDNWGKVSEALRQSVNAPIQGAASDFALFSSILIREAKRQGELPSSLDQVGTVHDSLIFYLNPEDVHTVVPILYNICRNPETKKWFNFEVKGIEMKVDFEVSEKSWGDLKGYNKDINYTKLSRLHWATIK